MARQRMHADEVFTDEALMRRLLEQQFPQWANLPISLVDSYGTDHDIYRIGDELSARMPRLAGATEQATIEATWLPRLAPLVPLAVPLQLAAGEPNDEYPFAWSVYEWLPGDNSNGTLSDLDQAAVDLAGFIRALRLVPTDGAHSRQRGHRGSPLRDNDAAVQQALRHLGDRIDGDAAGRVWADALAAAPWSGAEVWVHGDLLPGNLLVVDGRLSAVIDFGGFNVGDPACDLQPAWNSFAGSSRQRFRAELEVDDDSWQRGRGWVLYQTVSGLAYYWDTNPGMVRQVSHGLEQLLQDS